MISRILLACAAASAALGAGAGEARAAGPAASASAQTSARRGGPDLVARDARIGFDATSAQAARNELRVLRAGDPRRRVALLTLGASGAAAERAALIAAAAEGSLDDRAGALLALGELGPYLAEGLDALVAAAAGESGRLQGAALVALARSDQPAARTALARFAGGDGELGELAREVMRFAVDPGGAAPPEPWRELYELRWEAARAYGMVDDRPWRLVQVEELAQDEEFLSRMVLLAAPELQSAAARDLLLSILLDGTNPARIDAALRAMPLEVERMIEAGVWRPASRAEWGRFANVLLHGEAWRSFPASLVLAAANPDTRALAAGLLYRAGTPYEEALLESFRSPDPAARASAAFAVGAAGHVDFNSALRELSRDENPWVRANALASRVRMGEPGAFRECEALFATPPERRPPALTSYLLELLDRAAPDADVLAFLERATPGMLEADRVGAEAILVLHGRRSDKRLLRHALGTMDPILPETARVIRALGVLPSPEDLDVLDAAFPYGDSAICNLHLAAVLIRARHRAVDPLLASALWTLPRDESLLAAGIVFEARGAQVLRQWAARPPAMAREEDLCRIGFALGYWGGPNELEALRAGLGSRGGAEEPVLRGAWLGMLASRTL